MIQDYQKMCVTKLEKICGRNKEERRGSYEKREGRE
jgi:hypothetical protein